MPKDLKNCIKTWERILPDFEITRWDEQNSPIEVPFVKQAYSEKKWAFVADYVRFWALYHFGGIYLDTDMYLVKRFDDLLNHPCFIGAENPNVINCGIIGSIPNHWFTKACLERYQTLEFDTVFHPLVTNVSTDILKKEGFNSVNKITWVRDLVIYPSNFFYPYPYPPQPNTNFKNYSRPESIAIHIWKSSWHSVWQDFIAKRYRRGVKRLIEDLQNKSNLSLRFYIRAIYYIFLLNRLRSKLIWIEEAIFRFLIKNKFLIGFLVPNLSYRKKSAVFSKIDHSQEKFPSKNINRLGIKYIVDIAEHNGWRVFYLMFLPSTFQLFKQIKPGDYIIDIGANIGFYTLMSARHAPRGKVYAIEPDPHNYNALIKNIELNNFNNIFPALLAFGSEYKKVSLENFSFDDNNGMKRINHNSVNQEPNIQMITLDDFVEEKKINKIDWIKVDIEGYEHELLKGALKTISKYRPNFFIEICDQHLKHYNSSAIKLVKAFEDNGYRVIHADLNREISSNFYLEDCFFDAFCFPY